MDNERDEDIAELVAGWLASDLSAQKRFAAIDTLIERSPDIAKPVLLAVAERTAEPRPILEAAGVGLARMERSGVKGEPVRPAEYVRSRLSRLGRLEATKVVASWKAWWAEFP
jgi:hypothetical protein